MRVSLFYQLLHFGADTKITEDLFAQMSVHDIFSVISKHGLSSAEVTVILLVY